jgi:hypothetical protein
MQYNTLHVPLLASDCSTFLYKRGCTTVGFIPAVLSKQIPEVAVIAKGWPSFCLMRDRTEILYSNQILNCHFGVSGFMRPGVFRCHNPET